MPLAVTHVILTIVIVDLIRDYYLKKHITLHMVFIAGVAGLLPDIDIPINWVLSFFGYSFEIMQHGGLTHTALFGLIFLIPAFILLKKEKHKMATYFFVITFGILFHVFLDYFLGGGRFEGVMWLWPFSNVGYKIHLLSKLGLSNVPAALDAVILLGWLWHEDKKHKIRDYI